MLTKIKADNMQPEIDQMPDMPIADLQQQLKPMPANMQGGRAQDFITQPQQLMGEQMFGDQSLPTPMFMSNKQEEAFGPGSKVYESGNTAIYEGLK
tara:strand:- start:256 stop:543 length:288 start_codon:yes stop_codon:yes gene_type:complete